MKINIGKKEIFIYKKYKSSETIVPLGCDCHPAHILEALELRKQSLPFDWLYTNSKYGLTYALDNIKNNFQDFLVDLTLNDRGYPSASKYPYTEFFHEKNLISSDNDRIKMQRRAKRLLETINNKNCTFLCFINPENFISDTDVSFFIESINSFSDYFLNKHRLHIFIKLDESSGQDLQMTKKLFNKINVDTNVGSTLYYLNRKKFGIWGNPKDFYPLLKNAGIKIKQRIIPAVKIS